MRTRISNALLYSLILLLPAQLGKHFFPNYTFLTGVRIDYLSPALYLTTIIAVGIIVLNLETVRLFLSKKIAWLFILGALINTAMSVTWQVALYKWGTVFVLILLFQILRSSRLNPKLILKLFLIGAIIQLTLCTIQLATGHSLQGIWYYMGERYYRASTPGIAVSSIGIHRFVRPYGTFSHPNSLGGFYVLLYFFSLTFPPFNKHPMLKTALLAACSMLVLVSFSKTAIVTFAVLNVMYLLKNRKALNCTICLLSRIFMIAVFAAIVLSASGDVNSGTKRVELIDNAISIIREHAVWGVGLGNYLYEQVSFPNRYPYFFLQPVHNIILLFFAETGIVLGLFFLYEVWNGLKTAASTDTVFYMSLTVLLTGMLDHYWLTLHQNMLLLAVVFGFAMHAIDSTVYRVKTSEKIIMAQRSKKLRKSK